MNLIFRPHVQLGPSCCRLAASRTSFPFVVLYGGTSGRLNSNIWINSDEGLSFLAPFVVILFMKFTHTFFSLVLYSKCPCTCTASCEAVRAASCSNLGQRRVSQPSVSVPLCCSFSSADFRRLKASRGSLRPGSSWTRGESDQKFGVSKRPVQRATVVQPPCSLLHMRPASHAARSAA